MRDALRGYLSMANGLAEVSRQRAAAAAKALLTQGEATAEQVSQLTDELIETSRSNREALSNLIRYEVDRTLDQMGLVTSDKFRALAARIATLEAEVRAAWSNTGGPSRADADGPAPTTQAPPKRTGAKKARAKKSPATKSTATKSQARTAPASKAPAKKSSAPKSSAKKAPAAKKSPASKSARSTAKKAPAPGSSS